MLDAELHIAAEDFPGARRALGDLSTAHPDARSLTIMAAIERGEGADDHIVRAWLAKAVTASRGPQWICDKCGHIHESWRPICAHCHSFDSLSWQEAPQSASALSGPAQMLPLIVGALDRPGDEPRPDPSPGEEADIIDAEPGFPSDGPGAPAGSAADDPQDATSAR